jgi:hypothetical protein
VLNWQGRPLDAADATRTIRNAANIIVQFDSGLCFGWRGNPAGAERMLRTAATFRRQEKLPAEVAVALLWRLANNGREERTDFQVAREIVVSLAWLLERPTDDAARPGRWIDYAGRLDLVVAIDLDGAPEGIGLTMRAIPGTTVM